MTPPLCSFLSILRLQEVVRRAVRLHHFGPRCGSGPAQEGRRQGLARADRPHGLQRRPLLGPHQVRFALPSACVISLCSLASRWCVFSIRAAFGKDKQQNAVHGSDSVEVCARVSRPRTGDSLTCVVCDYVCSRAPLARLTWSSARSCRPRKLHCPCFEMRFARI